MSAGRRNVKDMSKVFALLGIIALLSALLAVLCACKDNVPEKTLKDGTRIPIIRTAITA